MVLLGVMGFSGLRRCISLDTVPEGGQRGGMVREREIYFFFAGFFVGFVDVVLTGADNFFSPAYDMPP